MARKGDRKSGAELRHFLNLYETACTKTDAQQAAVSSIHAEIAKTNAMTESACKRLREAYRSLTECSAAESNLLFAASRAVRGVLRQRDTDAAQSQLLLKRQANVVNSLDNFLPTWPSGTSIPLCGGSAADGQQPLTPGHQVAACTSKPKEDEHWILTSVVGYDKEKVVVEDVYEEGEQVKRYTLSQKYVVPLSIWRPHHDHTHLFFKVGQAVLALYPQTTCFYRAEVHEQPNKDRDSYLLHFDDDDFEDGRVQYQSVPVRFVVPFKTWKKG
eukprot:m.63818 g.63818  ORF g.63818 m.63818 type:complete len:272 (+) comp13880_c0_seq1:58-873(+)